MNKTLLEFNHSPSILPTLYKALVLPRPGVKAEEMFPEIEGKLLQIPVDLKNLKDYCKLCQLPMSDVLPPLYPHVIAGTLHMHILTHPKFPIKLLGAVHKYNTIQALKEIKTTDKLDVYARLGQPRYFPKGLEFDLITEVNINNELAWVETSTYFVRKSFKNIPEEQAPIAYLEACDCNQEIATWKLHALTGKKYALICKDFNPIHISGPLAKLFGFKKDLVHGMCSAAQSLGKVGISGWSGKTIKMYFKGPSYMGSRLSLKKSSNNDGRYDLFCGSNDRPVISIGIA